MKLLDRFGAAEVSPSFLNALVAGAELTASLVVSEQGDFVDAEGTSKGLGSPADRVWLGALRRQSQVVLTSGATFRAEAYRMPKTADLAVLTRKQLDSSHLEPKTGQHFHLLGGQDSYRSSISTLQGIGYERIHVEFGPAGMKELLSSGPSISLFLSGPSHKATELAAQKLGVSSIQLCETDGLSLSIAR